MPRPPSLLREPWGRDTGLSPGAKSGDTRNRRDQRTQLNRRDAQGANLPHTQPTERQRRPPRLYASGMDFAQRKQRLTLYRHAFDLHQTSNGLRQLQTHLTASSSFFLVLLLLSHRHQCFLKLSLCSFTSVSSFLSSFLSFVLASSQPCTTPTHIAIFV